MDLTANANDNHTASFCRSPGVMAFNVQGSSSSITAALVLFHAMETVWREEGSVGRIVLEMTAVDARNE